ncbi:MAG: tetratricopeptide repeat protein [Lachnospiraceae bacterium]|nr:tetratricopeptide repeat protein [Lachnospiraceae bacterium]
MQKKKLLVSGVGLLLGLMISGCSLQKAQGNLDQGFDAIASLEYENALTFFEAAAEEGEEPQQISRGKGIALLGLTRYEEAIEEFLTALSYSDAKVDEFDYDTNYYLAAAYFKLEKLGEAEAVYTAILNLRPEKEAYYMRGVVYLNQGELKKASLDFDEALKLAPTDYDLRIEIYQAMAEKGYKEEGKTYLQAVMGNTGTKLSDQEKGRFSYYLEDYESARSYLESLKGEKDSETTLLLGQTYEKLGDFNYAASIYSNFLADHNEDVMILNRLGMCKLEAGEAETALEYFNRALEIGDSSMTQVLKFNQIVAYEYLGDFDQANVLMKTYLQAYPDDQEALREYEFLKSR